ncbi:Kv channel-interacting protein 1-like isoform X1 [Limulus polyphemus]|uniref:Kv channel-interacting protein 1-like isoform X1 n=2 Tax=Limulus polyphemus TaxID=6850 RepID=A0ABM1T2Q3_LIMPO|nr:Kv channel-interacting protein 1-like isoform X1 [Limulus polyphemus]
MSSDESQTSSPDPGSSSGGARMKQYSLIRLSHEQEDSFTEIQTPKMTDVTETREVKDLRYWVNKFRQALRTVRFSKTRRKQRYGSIASSYDSEYEEVDVQQDRYTPEALDNLCEITKFNKRELQLMYRGFKQECPSGMVKEETFKGIYAQYFPRGGDTSQYAHYVFNTFDQDHTGSITFTDFVVGLSALSRGSVQEKLKWTFNLYDINGDGYITKDELFRIVTSIYDQMGRAVDSVVDDHTTKEHVDKVFKKLDLNQDGVVTMDEFLDSCTRDENITKSIGFFDTVL